MAKLLMNDDIDHHSQWHPTHVVGKDGQLINVYIGVPLHMLGGHGIYVADRDYDNINHTKAYMLIHNPDCIEDDIDSIDWDAVQDAEEHEKKTDREHMHIWQE